MHRTPWRLAAALSVVAAVACRPEFQLKKFTTNEALYTASLNAFQHHHWDDAISGFEKLTSDLPPRDSLLPRSYWYLATSHARNGEHLLAAQSYSRLVESFPDDSLAPDASLAAAQSYKKMWRKPELDATYGQEALASYNTLIGLYPTSRDTAQAKKDIAELENWFAIKDYDAGMYYFRRKAFISASLYFKDVLAKYPNTPTARDAGVKLVAAYKEDHYREDASDLCAQLDQRYPTDRKVRDVCTGVAPPPAKPDSAPPSAAEPPAAKPPAF
jgi:outer membrane protein assembly factor BamD